MSSLCLFVPDMSHSSALLCFALDTSDCGIATLEQEEVHFSFEFGVDGEFYGPDLFVLLFAVAPTTPETRAQTAA